MRNDATRLVIMADEDDYGTLSVKNKLKDSRVTWSIEPRPDALGTKYNRVMKIAPADVYMVMVDYAPCVTENFDNVLLEAAQVYPDGYSIIINHLANLSFSQMNAVTHKLAAKLGGIYPEYFPYWFVDHWLEEMAKRLGRQVYCDIVMDCARRPGTIGKKEPYLWGALFTWLRAERERKAVEIIDSEDFDETPARKVALKRNFALWDQWSFAINYGLKDDPGEEVHDDDERYLRLRNPALKFIEEAVKANGLGSDGNLVS